MAEDIGEFVLEEDGGIAEGTADGLDGFEATDVLEGEEGTEAGREGFLAGGVLEAVSEFLEGDDTLLDGGGLVRDFSVGREGNIDGHQIFKTFSPL